MFKLGLENIKEAIPNGKIGLITNIGSVTSNLEVNIDYIISQGFQIGKIFTPEHGLYGTEADGTKIKDSTFRGIPVTSLYGEKMKPERSDLEELDYLVYDIQDAGVRFYTFISTLYNMVEASKESGIPLYVLDRPNPLNSNIIQGPVLKEEYKSFVGIDMLPSRYGLTIGELALFFNRRFKGDVNVVQMSRYSRNFYFDDIYKWFIPPSLNLPDMDAIINYSGLCLLEATDLSVGRGTPYPFHFFGRPNLPELDLSIDEVKLRRTKYRPTIDPFRNQLVEGYFIHIMDRATYDPFRLALKIIISLWENDKELINRQKLAQLYGSDHLYTMLGRNTSVKEIMDTWKTEHEGFRKSTAKFHLY